MRILRRGSAGADANEISMRAAKESAASRVTAVVSETTLKLISPAPSSWLDRALDVPVSAITFTLQTPAFHIPDLLKGEPSDCGR